MSARRLAAGLGLLFLAASTPLAAQPWYASFSHDSVVASASRTVAMHVWRPHRARGAGQLAWRELITSRGDSAAARTRFRDVAQAGHGVTVTDAILRTWLDTPVDASLGPVPLAGRRPAVLLVTGMDDAAYSLAHLAVALARAGFVTATIGSGSFAEQPLRDFDAAGIRAHVADVTAALTRLRSLPDVDTTRIVVGGWSVGGLSAVVAAEGVPGVGGAFSLDGATGFAYGESLLSSLRAPSWRWRVPMLVITAGIPGTVRRSSWFLERGCSSELWEVSIPSMAHRHFVSYWGPLAPPQLLGAEHDAVVAGAAQVAEVVVAFADGVTGGPSRSPDGVRRRTLAPCRSTGLP